MTPARKPIIGLVGRIGAGKSTVARLLASRGGLRIDADALGHEALDVPEIQPQIVARWGKDMLKPDGTVNRQALAAVVFANHNERQVLEALVHPEIRRRAERALVAADADPSVRFVVLDAALLLEAGWADLCDRIILVDAPQDVRLARVQARSGWTAADLAKREAAQWPIETKRQHADVILENRDSPEMLAIQVDSLLNSWGLVPESTNSIIHC